MFHLDVKQAWLVLLWRHVVEAAGNAALQVMQRLPKQLRVRKHSHTQHSDLEICLAIAGNKMAAYPATVTLS